MQGQDTQGNEKSLAVISVNRHTNHSIYLFCSERISTSFEVLPHNYENALAKFLFQVVYVLIAAIMFVFQGNTKKIYRDLLLIPVFFQHLIVNYLC